MARCGKEFFKESGQMKFDVDYSHLEIGDEISQSECEAIVQATIEQAVYSIRVMQLCEQISKQLWAVGKRYTVATVRGRIRVLTHEEASIYNASRFENSIDKMKRCHTRLLAVDTGELNEERRRMHERECINTSKMLAVIGQTKKEIRLEAHRSTLPKKSF
jgi:hypothetical protein